MSDNDLHDGEAERMAEWERMKKQMRLIPELFCHDSPRAAVIVAVAMVDDSLESLLESKFKRESTITDKVCAFLLRNPGNPPIGSLVVRARLAFALGLLGRSFKDCIEYVARIRNEMAHKPLPTPIDSSMGKHLYKLLDPSMRDTVRSVLAETKRYAKTASRQSRHYLLVVCCAVLSIAIEVDARLLQSGVL
jgi:DNA-binding MltR family transcriptional regulator